MSRSQHCQNPLLDVCVCAYVQYPEGYLESLAAKKGKTGGQGKKRKHNESGESSFWCTASSTSTPFAERWHRLCNLDMLHMKELSLAAGVNIQRLRMRPMLYEVAPRETLACLAFVTFNSSYIMGSENISQGPACLACSTSDEHIRKLRFLWWKMSFFSSTYLEHAA